jgi:hypothetical protein
MAKSGVLERKRKKDTVLVNAFAGIDRSTARYKIEGKGERLYEASNVFPYIQGDLLRRKDAVETNSRDSNAAFPTFPAGTMTGDPVVKKVVEYNGLIVILYEDDGDTGKLLVDSFDVGSNTLTNRLQKAAGYTFTSGGKVDAVPFALTSVTDPLLVIAPEGAQSKYFNTAWTLATAIAQDTEGINEVFLQAYFYKKAFTSGFSEIARAAVASFGSDVKYYLTDFATPVLRMISFGYQTSSAGATSIMVIFKSNSMWAMTGIGSTESFEQITGNIGLAGRDAVTYTPFGLCFAGRDTDGLINLYLLDRNSLVLHTIGHELYEELNDIPADNYTDIVLSYHRNRMVRIAMTNTGDSVANNKEYWMDFYNGLKKRTLWGPNPLPASNSLLRAISFSGGADVANSGFFMLLKEGALYKIYEEVNTDTYNSTDSEWDDQVWRTKMYDFGRYYGIIDTIIIVARANGAKFKVYYEEPKLAGDDNDTTQTLIGSFQMGTGGARITKPIRIVPAILKNQIGIKIESDYDGDDNEPLELAQLGFEYEVTQREVIE